ncbi:hypothetical protein 7F16_10 [uncultured Caudovirales phage]|uniref:NTP pyrophosphohydrolase MazG-like domain-containing protein n=3 Tax=root TaxID=1 RepID=A0A2H4JG35_9CAUD|nr:hypothetical protein 7F16_10 [uncultured Caudovirales phage]
MTIISNKKVDMVNEPPHYQFGKFSARMIIELVGKTYKSASVFYHVGNALKYLMRAPRKNGLEDLKKAKQSVEFAIENWEAKSMNNTLDQLVEQVQQWSIDKDLHNGNSDRQALKFYEEAGEVASALSRGKMDALKDGIGDTVVTLIILAQQHDMTLQECLQYAYDEIKGRKGRTINGTFIKESDLNG